MSNVSVLLQSIEPVKVARQYARERFPETGNRPTIWTVDSQTWVWYGGRWASWDRGTLRSDLMVWLEDARVGGADGERKRFVVYPKKVDDILDCLGAITRLHLESTPVWVGEEGPDPMWCVAFEDVVVHIGEDGTLTSRPRTNAWLDNVMVPCTWEAAQAGTTEIWERCLQEWGEGDTNWVKRAERWVGYCLVADRKYARWLHPFGKPRSGKTLYAEVIHHLVGTGAFMERTMKTLARKYGTRGIHEARCLCVSEVTQLEKGDGEVVEGFLKQVLGGNSVESEKKYVDAVYKGCHAAPMLVGNEMVLLPDSNKGLTSKMLMLPFGKSYLGHEDWDLPDKLRAELPGIAYRAVKAAGELRKASHAAKWPVPEKEAALVKRLRGRAHIGNAFLDGRFKSVPGNFMPFKTLWLEWRRFEAELGERLPMSQRTLFDWIEVQSGWDVRRGELNGQRGFYGIGMLRVVEAAH